MNDLPMHSEKADLGELGVRLVEAAIHDELKWYKDYNQRNYGYERLTLCLIGHHQSAFNYVPDFESALVQATDVQVIRMLVATSPFFTVNELNEKGEIIDEYIRGELQTYSSWK